MRKIFAFLLLAALLAPLAAVGADTAPQEGGPVLFQDGEIEIDAGDDDDEGCGCGCGCDDGCGTGAIDMSVEGEPQVVKDTAGNFSLTLPPGWSIDHEPQPDKKLQLRLRASRAAGGEGDVMFLEVYRFTSGRAETFTIDTPGDVLDSLHKNNKIFEQFFGDGSSRVVTPQVDDSSTLGGADKSTSYELRSITMQEQVKIDKAEAQVRRGDKSVEVPKYKPIVIRGRIALISPNIYFVRTVFRRSLADNEQVIAEYKKVVDSWKFLTSDAIPAPLQLAGMRVGNTKADKNLAKDRKTKHVYSERARKTYNLELKFTIPAGFQRITKNLGKSTSLILVAQDDKNNWVSIAILHLNLLRWSEANPNKILATGKREICATWKSNWESKARGVKMKAKAGKVSLGGSVRGDGYKMVEGNVEGFRGTFSGIVHEKSGWRTQIEVETRGDGDKVFGDGIKKFFKSLKLKKVK